MMECFGSLKQFLESFSPPVDPLRRHRGLISNYFGFQVPYNESRILWVAEFICDKILLYASKKKMEIGIIENEPALAFQGPRKERTVKQW